MAAHALREALQGEALFGGGLIVDNQHGFHRVDVFVEVAKGAAGVDYAHDGEAVKGDALPRAGFDLPAHDGKVAGDAGFRVGEAGAGVDVGGAGFHVFAV